MSSQNTQNKTKINPQKTQNKQKRMWLFAEDAFLSVHKRHKIGQKMSPKNTQNKTKRKPEKMQTN